MESLDAMTAIISMPYLKSMLKILNNVFNSNLMLQDHGASPCGRVLALWLQYPIVFTVQQWVLNDLWCNKNDVS